MAQEKSSNTLRDVAKRAGVSVATASRVLSDSGYPVSPELRRRVNKAATEMKYVPNVFGKMLKSNTSSVIGIIVPTLQNPFYNQVISGIESAAAKTGHEIRLFSSHRSVEQEHNNILILLNSRIMSLIILSIDNKPDALKNYIACGGKVALLEADFSLEHSIVAETDCFEAGRLAAWHLADLGHRNIAFLTSPITKSFRRRILMGVRAGLAEKNCPFGDEDIFVASGEAESRTGMYEFEIGKLLAHHVIDGNKRYTAIIAINDITAFGVIQSLTKRGYSVPDDISVISFDNITYSEMISPPLTTVELPSGNMGYTACQMLISAMDSDVEPMESFFFKYPGVLRVRESTKKCVP